MKSGRDEAGPCLVDAKPQRHELKCNYDGPVVDERKCVQLHVRPGVMWPLSTSDIRIEVDIARHRHHRQLVITWDGGSSGGGSSVQSLDGEGEPFLHVRTIKDAPAAPWQFVAEVYDDHGRVVGRDTAEIRMPEGDQ